MSHKNVLCGCNHHLFITTEAKYYVVKICYGKDNLLYYGSFVRSVLLRCGQKNDLGICYTKSR